MKLLLSSLALVLGAAVLPGCASADKPAPAVADTAPKVYRTGSNIPVKDTGEKMSDAERERTRQEMLNQSGLAAQKAAGSK